MNSSKDIILLSTAYLPNIDYFVHIAGAKQVWVEQFETYPKQTFRNRAEILSGNGKLRLSIPVNKVHGNHTLIKNVEISPKERWQLNHWRAIYAAYNASPFYLFYADELESFYNNHFENLLEFNTALFQQICELVGIAVNLQFTKDYQKAHPDKLDLRNRISPKSPPISKEFHSYMQVFSNRFPFHPNLSILDLLFNLGPETNDYLSKIQSENI